MLQSYVRWETHLSTPILPKLSFLGSMKIQNTVVANRAELCGRKQRGLQKELMFTGQIGCGIFSHSSAAY